MIMYANTHNKIIVITTSIITTAHATTTTTAVPATTTTIIIINKGSQIIKGNRQKGEMKLVGKSLRQYISRVAHVRQKRCNNNK